MNYHEEINNIVKFMVMLTVFTVVVILIGSLLLSDMGQSLIKKHKLEITFAIGVIMVIIGYKSERGFFIFIIIGAFFLVYSFAVLKTNLYEGGNEMYFITKPEQLQGKVIEFTNMDQSIEEYLIIVTKDGGIFAIEQTELDYGKSLGIPSIDEIKRYVFNTDYITEKLLKHEVITESDINEYKEEIETKHN